jgi:hypothetical protein
VGWQLSKLPSLTNRLVSPLSRDCKCLSHQVPHPLQKPLTMPKAGDQWCPYCLLFVPMQLAKPHAANHVRPQVDAATTVRNALPYAKVAGARHMWQ